MQAEQLACDALLADGWSILARRARTAAGEIDIVVRRGDLLAFVEVKARPSLAEAACAVGARQRRRILVAAAALLAAHPDWWCGSVRFDLVLVDGTGTVRRITDAFRDEGECS